MRMYFSIVVAVVGSAAAFDGTLPLLFGRRGRIYRIKFEAALTGLSNTDIIEESTTTSITGCVKTETSLRDAVRKARTKGPTYTKITLCTKSLTMSDKIDPYGIDVSNKWLDIRCGLTDGNCAINGQGLSGFFYGESTNIKIQHVNFVNGYNTEYCPMFFTESNVQVSHSSFQKNVGLVGFLYMGYGDLLKLDDVTFVQNTATELANVYLYNVTTSTISSTSFKSNSYMEADLYIERGDNLELSDVNFEQNSPKGNLGFSAVIDDVVQSTISGTLFKSNEGMQLYVFGGGNSLITDSTFDSNYKPGRFSSAVIAELAEVTLKGVSFVNNVLGKKNGNTVGSAFSNVTLLECTFTNNHGPDGSTKSSSVRVYDLMCPDCESYADTTLLCSNTKFCDGFPSDETIVDQHFKAFDAPTCTSSLDC